MAKVDILNYISDSNILRSTYDTDTNELDITDVPQNLNSVITLGQGGGGAEVEELNVTANGTYTAPEGKAYSPVNVNVSEVEYTYHLGGYYYQSTSDNKYVLEVFKNHLKITRLTASGGTVIAGLRQLNVTLCPLEWFHINSGDDVKITYKNVINESGIVWNCNFKQTNTTTSMSYGIGDATHLNGEVLEQTAVSNESVGCLFLYILQNYDGILEFDVEIEINGTRIL